MGQNFTKRAQIFGVLIFGVVAFGISGAFVWQKNTRISADAPGAVPTSEATATQVSPVALNSPTTTADTSTSQNSVQPTPSVTPGSTIATITTPTASSTPLASTVSSSGQVTPTTTKTDSKPFYTDMSFLLLVLDGLIITGLIIVLIIRLMSKLFSQPVVDKPKPKSKKNDLVTIDQLDIDIPV